MKPNIIVMQTSHTGFMVCREIFEGMGLKRNKDFYLTEDEPELDSFVPDTRQIFITGSFSGSEEGVGSMVQAARDHNKELITVSFALSVLDGPFDYSIRKGVGARDQIREMIQNFLNGTLVRTEVKWEPPKKWSYSGL